MFRRKENRMGISLLLSFPLSPRIVFSQFSLSWALFLCSSITNRLHSLLPMELNEQADRWMGSATLTPGIILMLLSSSEWGQQSQRRDIRWRRRVSSPVMWDWSLGTVPLNGFRIRQIILWKEWKTRPQRKSEGTSPFHLYCPPTPWKHPPPPFDLHFQMWDGWGINTLYNHLLRRSVPSWRRSFGERSVTGKL